MFRRAFVLGAVALALAGCQTVATNTLSVDDVATMKFAGVDVRFAPDARILWGDGERAYAASKGQPATESDELAKTPEGQAYLRNTIATKLKGAMEKQLAGGLNGKRPVRVVVTVKAVQIASAIQRILIGGHHHMVGDVTLTDAKTGAALLSYEAQGTMAMAGQGIGGTLVDAALMGEPIDRVVNNYAETYSGWLLRRNPAPVAMADR